MSDVIPNSGEEITTASASSEQDANPITTQAPVSNEQDASTVTAPTSPSAPVEDYKLKYEALAPKVSGLEKERNDYSKKAKEKEDTLKAVDKIFEKNPEAYEVFRKSYLAETGVDLGDHSKAYNIQPTQTPTQTKPAEQPSVQTIAKQVQEELKKEEDNKVMATDVESFLTDHPDYRTDEVTDPEIIKDKEQKLAYIAQTAIVRKSFFPNLTWKEALEDARASLPEARSEISQRSQAIGEKIGKATAYSSGAAMGKAPSGDNSNANSMDRSLYDKLNPLQQRRYDEHIKRGDAKFANSYAKRVLEGD